MAFEILDLIRRPLAQDLLTNLDIIKIWMEAELPLVRVWEGKRDWAKLE